MAIWPVTVPALVHSHKRWVVAVLALPVEVRSNPGIQAQNEDVAEEDRFGSGAWAFCMMTRGMSTPLMTMVNCTCPFGLEQTAVEEAQEEKDKNIKN